MPFAWYSLDEDDNDPTRFLTYFISALAGIASTIAEDILSQLQTSQPPPPKVVMAALISRLETISVRVALVLDDYHLIVNPVIHDALVFLLEHLPAAIHVIVVSRDDPPLPLARWRGRGQLAEIRAEDLRFTHHEAAEFLQHTLGFSLTAEQVSELDGRTEGWIAGLQLAALAMRGRADVDGFISAFTGSHRFVLDYLTEEVLNRQPPELRRFLLETSILDRLSGPLCDVVTGRTDSHNLLDQIDRANLFLIALDDEGYWFRYHHLFNEMLSRHLQHTSPQLVPALHRRASAWFEQNGLIAEAVEHALMTRDEQHVAQIVEQYAEYMWMHGELATVMRWLRSLPDAVFRLRPRLGLTYGVILTMLDDYAEAERRVTEAEHVLARSAHIADEDEYEALLGHAAVARASVSLLRRYAGSVTIDAGRTALAYLPDSEVRWRAWANLMVGIAYSISNGQMEPAELHLREAVRLGEVARDALTILIGLSQLSRMYMVWGRLRQAEITVKMLIENASLPTARAQGQFDRSQIRFEHNDLAGAQEDLDAAFSVLGDYLLKRFTIDGRVKVARLKVVLGSTEEATALMEQAVKIARSANLVQTFVSEAAWQAWLWIKLGDLSAAAGWAHEIEPTIDPQLDPSLEFEHMTFARLLIAQGQLEQAEALLSRLLSAAQDAGRAGRVIAICVLQALAFHRHGDTENALKSLGSALALAEPEGHIRSFIDEGTEMAALLREALNRGFAVNYVTQLLSAFEREPSPAQVPSRQAAGRDEIESLSARELEVLRLIADGASNREIADALVVSLGTVKKHLNNIFLKLDAHSRTQALATARKYYLLS